MQNVHRCRHRRAAESAGRVPTLQAWGRLEARAGDLAAARRLFQQAADLEPDNVFVLQVRATFTLHCAINDERNCAANLAADNVFAPQIGE